MAMYLRELTIRFGTARASDGERVRLPVGKVVASPREVASLLYPLHIKWTQLPWTRILLP